ncbi:MAG TPA: D-2-hydroxyacid dehydrogenase [Longimicrobiaceae bacterium]
MTRRAVIDLRDARPLWALPDWALAEIRAAFPPEWETVAVDAHSDGRGDGGGPSPEALAAVPGAEVYMGYGIPPELFRAAGDGLRWVHSGAAGVGGALYPEMRDSRVVLTNSAGMHAEPIADTVLAMALHFARGLDFAVRAQAERRWDKASFEAADAPVRETGELAVGILGLGGIGRAVARRFAALGARVLATRRGEGDAPEGVELVRGDGALGRLLEASDVLVVAVPDTPETRGMLGRAELERLPRGAVLVNVARGRVLDEDALVEALREGRLRGAALDVFAREPLPAESPLWGLSNVLVTPHVSGTSHRYWRRETGLVVENVRRYLAGEPLLNTVDKHAGY